MGNIEPVDPTFLLTNQIKHDLQNLAADGYPLEVCGLIHHHGIIHQYPNTFCGDKHHGFDMEVDISNDVKAIWHSHPTGPEGLSDDDIEAMGLFADQGFDFPWIVVTLKGVTAWGLAS
jgi:proteasome lid subunit RPN8/RPN11